MHVILDLAGEHGMPICTRPHLGQYCAHNATYDLGLVVRAGFDIG
jgi:hypothetical protein